LASGMEYFTKPFFDEMANLLNADADFQSKAANVSTSLKMVCHDKSRQFVLKVDKGKVSAADATTETPADFVFIADYPVWITNHKGESTLEKLIMTGKVKLKGSIPRLLGLKSQLGAVDQIGRKIEATY
ncbi:MAG: SCP2 sterol-binding domain-containing protein, partial [Thermoplasmatota archaeon]